MQKILLVFLSLVFFSSASFSQSKKIKHVVLIGFDGLGAYAFDSAKVPNLRTMMSEGSWSLNARSVLPSSSAVNWASMLMGAGPTLHGYTEWDSNVPEIPSVIKDKYGIFPSIFGVLKQQKPQSKSGVIYTWGRIGYLFEKQAVNLDLHTSNDTVSLEETIDFIKKEKPTLTFVHFDEPDGVGHNIGHRTKEYYTIVENLVDKYVGAVRKAIKDAGIEDNTVVIVTSDHGGIAKGHGGKSMDEVQIPWIITGPGIKKNHEIKNVIITFDTAATIAYALGLKAPQAWRGQPVLEAFEK